MYREGGSWLPITLALNKGTRASITNPMMKNIVNESETICDNYFIIFGVKVIILFFINTFFDHTHLTSDHF